VTLDVFSKYLKEQVMDIIDNDKKLKHSKLAEGVENAIQVRNAVNVQKLDTPYPKTFDNRLSNSFISDIRPSLDHSLTGSH
jgi:hypothetical protein